MPKKPSLKDFARTLDRQGGVKAFGAKPVRVEKIFVEQRTRVPLLIISLSGALLFLGLGYVAYQYGTDIQYQRILAEKRLAEQQTLNQYIGKHLLPTNPRADKTPSSFTITKPADSRKSLDVRKVAQEKMIPSIDGEGFVPAFTVQTPQSAKLTQPTQIE